MQLAINDYYINNSILSRNASASGLEQRGADAAEAFKSWYSKNPSGTVYGIGQNYVRLGASGHNVDIGDTITGFRQLGLDNNFDDPLEFVNSVFRQTDGNYIFNEDELKIVNSLMDKHFGQGVALDLEAGVNPITKSEDLIRLNKSSDPRLQPSNNDFTKHDEFLKDVSKELGIKSITNKTDPLYGNSIYASTLADFDEYLDNLGFGYLGLNIPKDIKSYSQRLAGYEGRSANIKKIDDIINSGDFKKVEGLIKGGLPKAKSRLAQLEQEAFEIERETQRLQSMYTAKDNARLEELKKQQDKIYKEWTDANSKVNDLQRLNWKLESLRSNIINVSAATGVAGGLGATTYLLWDKMSQNRDEWQKNPPGNRKRMPLPGGGYMEEPTNKKFGGEIKFGPKPFIGYLPFTHYQLK
jgi:hypothetical protein